MKYAFPALLVLVLLILGGAYWYQNNQTVNTVEPSGEVVPAEEEEAELVSEVEQEAETPASSSSDALTMSVVATHNTRESCWTVINGSVYDLTTWIARHPGGANAILRLCGTDGTATFEGQHGGQGGPESQLAEFRVGALAN